MHVDVLGPPRVRVGGAPVRFRSRKAEALTYDLAVERGRHSRARLAALLWDDVAGGANLRVILNDVRKHLGPHVIVDAATQRVGLTDVHCDVDALDGPATDAPNGRLGPQLRADPSLLEGFDVADAPAFEAWRDEADAHVRERLARLRAQALDAALDADDLPTALDLADATCRAAPWDVLALARLVRLALRVGANERAAHRLDGTETAVAEVGGDEALAQVAALRPTSA
ncbi:MAG: hypothetical protein RI554_11690, partial [Trueperaceae bacterium]|nr:hypothetical protein [Trueperaceae bacterium]